MNTINKAAEKEDGKIPAKMMLSALWVTLMFLYIYADIFSLYKPGQMEEVMAGRMGPLPVTQSSLLMASVLTLIPALMVFLSLALKPRVDRWANIMLGVLYSAVNIGNLVGETWAFYLFFGILEMAITLLIVGYAWKWPNLEVKPDVK